MKGTKDAPTPRPNKRPRLGPSPTDGIIVESISMNTSSKKDAKKPSGKTAQMDEYLQVMQSRNKNGPSWANEAPPPPPPTQPDPTPTSRKEDKVADGAPKEGEERDEAMSDLDWMKRRMTQGVDAADATLEEKAFEQSDDEDAVPVLVSLRLSIFLLYSHFIILTRVFPICVATSHTHT